jgi:hypothetical protein
MTGEELPYRTEAPIPVNNSSAFQPQFGPVLVAEQSSSPGAAAQNDRRGEKLATDKSSVSRSDRPQPAEMDEINAASNAVFRNLEQRGKEDHKTIERGLQLMKDSHGEAGVNTFIESMNTRFAHDRDNRRLVRDSSGKVHMTIITNSFEFLPAGKATENPSGVMSRSAQEQAPFTGIAPHRLENAYIEQHPNAWSPQLFNPRRTPDLRGRVSNGQEIPTAPNSCEKVHGKGSILPNLHLDEKDAAFHRRFNRKNNSE